MISLNNCSERGRDKEMFCRLLDDGPSLLKVLWSRPHDGRNLHSRFFVKFWHPITIGPIKKFCQFRGSICRRLPFRRKSKSVRKKSLISNQPYIHKNLPSRTLPSITQNSFVDGLSTNLKSRFALANVTEV